MPALTSEAAISVEQREAFERDGYVMIRGALSSSEVDYYSAALERVYAAERELGNLNANNSMHKLGAVSSCPAMADLLNHPATFPHVWSMIGWNIHAYHSHVDLQPPIRHPKAPRFEWHQDGGRQNRELETEPRPRLSVNVAFWLSDVTQPGRGNVKVVPGSHKTNWIDGPPQRDMEWPDPEGAIDIRAEPGDAIFFDRRLWHANSDNYSDLTRKMVFFGYTPRWIRARDDVDTLYRRPWWDDLDPVQQQLLGAFQPTGDHSWGHYPDQTPLYQWLASRDLLDPNNPPLKP